MGRLRTPQYLRAAHLLGSKIKALRKSRGLTQEQLEELTGISRNQIQNLEHNRNNVGGEDGMANPQLDTVFALAHALRVDFQYLIDPDRTADDLPLPTDPPQGEGAFSERSPSRRPDYGFRATPGSR